MRFLHLADLHIGKSVAGFSLLEQQEEVLGQVLQVLDEKKVQAVIIAGDIYDKSIPPREAVTLYNRFLAKAVLQRRIPVLAISGNHDSRERLEAGNQLSREAGYYVEGLLKEEISRVSLADEWGEVDFYLIPFGDLPQMRELYPEEEIKTFDQGWRALMKGIHLRPGIRSVAVAHCYAVSSLREEGNLDQEIVDSQKPLTIGGKDFMEAEVFGDFSYAALGHLHRRQKVGRENICYSGTLLKYSFSEENHRKTMTLVEIKGDGEIKTEQIPVKQSREWRTIRGFFEDILRRALEEKERQDFIRFILEDETLIADAMPRLKEYYPFAMELSYERRERAYQEHGRREESRQLSLMEMLEQFYKELHEKELPSRLGVMAGEILEEMEAEKDEA